MTLSGKKFNGVKYFRSRISYNSKKAADNAAKEWRTDGFHARVRRSAEKFKGRYQYHIYTRKK